MVFIMLEAFSTVDKFRNQITDILLSSEEDKFVKKFVKSELITRIAACALIIFSCFDAVGNFLLGSCSAIKHRLKNNPALEAYYPHYFHAARKGLEDFFHQLILLLPNLKNPKPFFTPKPDSSPPTFPASSFISCYNQSLNPTTFPLHLEDSHLQDFVIQQRQKKQQEHAKQTSKRDDLVAEQARITNFIKKQEELEKKKAEYKGWSNWLFGASSWEAQRQEMKKEEANLNHLIEIYNACKPVFSTTPEDLSSTLSQQVEELQSIDSWLNSYQAPPPMEAPATAEEIALFEASIAL